MLSEIFQTEYVRQRQNSKKIFKNWPLYSSHALEYAECSYHVVVLSPFVISGKEMNKELEGTLIQPLH